MPASRRGIARWVILGVVGCLALVTLLFLRGPASWQRMYYPLRYRESIQTSARRHQVNPYLVAAIINAECGWDTQIESAQGAVGLMQVLPETAQQLASSKLVDAKRYPPQDLSNPDVNIEYGTAYLRYLVDRYHEIETALAAYNAGLAPCRRVGRSRAATSETAIEFPETKQYVLRGRPRQRPLRARCTRDAFERTMSDEHGTDCPRRETDRCSASCRRSSPPATSPRRSRS